MDEAPLQHITTPARRKNGRHNAKLGAQKAYASENDVAALEAPRQRGSPQTPRKGGHGTPTASDVSLGQLPNSRSKFKNKTKSKAGLVSPEPMIFDGQTPPSRSISMKPELGPAFAGATFHASPAPSSLPMPSFLGKATCESPLARGKGSVSPVSDQDAPSPFRPSSIPNANESPLDLMFRVHREEKGRHSKGHPLAHPQVNGESSRNLFQLSAVETTSVSDSPRPQPPQSSNMSGITDLRESDDDQRHSVGPSFATPYQERINAARATAKSQSSNPRKLQTGDSHWSQDQDPADALKEFLFKDPKASKVSAVTEDGVLESQFSNEKANTNLLDVAGDIINEPESGTIEAMENDLRRILKMNMSA